MLDLRTVTQNLAEVAKALARRGPGVDLSGIERLARLRREIITSSEAARHEQKEASPRLGRLLAQDPAAAEELRARLRALGEKVKGGEQEVAALDQKIEALLLDVPNLPHASVPDGTGPDDNKLVRYGRLPKPAMSQNGSPFAPRPHWEIGEALGILDFERAAKVSGARFAFYFGAAAHLERALVSFMLDGHTARGYREVLPPFLVNRASMTGTGQLPKFESEAFKTAGDHELFLIPTAEVPVTNLYRGEILEGSRLPLSYAA